MTNSLGQSPCLLAAWLLTPCNTAAGSVIGALPLGNAYLGPRLDDGNLGASACRCNTVFYAALAACATCQEGGSHVLP